MNIQNITGLEKPLEKLVDVVSEGLGVVINSYFEFDVKKIKRVGEAEAQIEKNKIISEAEGHSEAVQIIKRAEKRFALEQYNKQVNLENIIAGAKEILEGEEVSDEPVDKDWAFRFMNIAQDIGREDMQELLSRILAGEIKQPSTFSLRTLDFIKNLSKNDLIAFKKFAVISSSDSSIYISKDNANTGFSNITYTEIMEMVETGFIQPSLSTISKLGDMKKDEIYEFIFKDNQHLNFKFIEDTNNIQLPVLCLTVIGKEIASLLDIGEDKKYFFDYISDLREYFITKNMEYIESNSKLP